MTFRHSASLAVIAAALTLTACGGDEDARPAADPASEGAANSGADALAALGLSEPGRASWGERVQDGDGYVFTDFTLATDEAVLNADTVTLEDPRMSQNGPVFARLSVNMGEITYEDGSANFDTFSITDAGPGVGRALANLINGQGGLDDIPLDQQTFASMSLETLRVTEPGDASEGTGPSELIIRAIEAREFDGETLADFSLTDLAFDSEVQGGGSAAVDLTSIEASGVNVALLESGMSGEVASDPFMGAATGGFDQYDRIALDGLRAVAGGAEILMPSFVGEIEERGDRLISTAAMPTLTVSPSDNAEGEGFAEVLSQLGYETMAFSFASETEYDPDADRVTTTGDNYFAMEDGFLMSFEQDLSGVQAYTERMNAWLAETDLEAEANADEAAPTPPASVFEPLMIHSARIVLEDRSLLDRALTLLAEQQGSTPAQLRAQAGMFVAMGGAMAGDAVPPALLNQMTGALTSFIGEGGALIATFEPDEPVSAARFMAEDGPDLDGLSITREPAE